jgi:hypothetical protein
VCESSGSLAALEGHVLSQPTTLLEIRHVKDATVIRSVPRTAGVRHRRVVTSKDANRRLVGIPPMSQARPKVTWYNDPPKCGPFVCVYCK